MLISFCFARYYLRLLNVRTFFFFPVFNLIWVCSKLHKFILQCFIPLLLYASTHHLILMQTLLSLCCLSMANEFKLFFMLLRLYACLCLYRFTFHFIYSSTPLCLYTCTPLRLYGCTPVPLYAFTPLHFYFPTPLRLFVSKPLRLYVSTALRL